MMADAAGQTDFRSRLRSLDWRNLDLRRIAQPIAIASPLALIVSAQEAAMIAVALLFLAHSWRERDWSWARSGWFVALLTLWAYASLRTLLLNPTVTGVLTALQWIHFAIYAAALATWILPQARARDQLLWALAATIAFFSLDCLVQYVVGRDIIGRPMSPDRLTSVFGKPGVGAEIGWLFLPAVAGLWGKSHSIPALILGVVALAAVLLSGDRMALIFSLAAILLFCLFAARTQKALLVALPVVLLVLAALLYFNPGIYNRQIGSTETVLERVNDSVYGVIFKTALDVASDHPVFGVGVHNYQAVCTQDKYGALLVGPNNFKRCQGHPHNIYLQWLAETGGVGLALFSAFAVLVLVALERAARNHRGDVLFVALAVALALRLWPLQTATSFYSTWSAAPFFLILGWALVYSRSESADG
jgi:O-antigen ligase